MRTSLFLRRVPRPTPAARRALLSSTNPAGLPRKPVETTKPVRTSRRSASSKTLAPSPAPAPSPNNGDNGDGNTPPSSEAPSEDPPSESRNGDGVESAEQQSDPDASKAATALPKFSVAPDVFWSAEDLAANPPPASSLPPAQILEDALNSLYISLQPRTQLRATYSTASESAVEPTLALYCPIEGGEYIIDDTVRELARRSGSDVVVLDAAHMAAGEWGMFGPAGSLLHFPKNPLHFSAERPPVQEDEDEAEEDDYEGEPEARGHVMALQLLSPMLQRRSAAAAPTKNSSPLSPGTTSPRMFFDLLVNRSIPAVQEQQQQQQQPQGAAMATATAATSNRRPRIIYIRDFPMIAPSAAAWYPTLVSVVRQRRQGVRADSASGRIDNPAVIVFGMTPPLTSQSASSLSQSSSGSSLRSSSSFPSSSSRRSEYRNAASSSAHQQQHPQSSPRSSKGSKMEAEDEAADKIRERRLRERLRKWERSDGALLEDIPRLDLDASGEDGGISGSSGRSRVVFIKDLQGPLALPFGGASSKASASAASGDADTGYFRTSILVPETRSPAREKETRIARRREINQLTMKMGVGAVGGVLEGDYAPTTTTPAAADKEAEDKAETAPVVEDEMWDEWGQKLKSWRSVGLIADQVVGNATASWLLANAVTEGKRRPPAAPLPVTWEGVRRAWSARRELRDVRKAWVKSAGKSEEQEEGEEKVEEDSVVEQVKQDPDLDPHEQRLLGTIVNSVTMTTTFEQVHLPPQTIDSVRTIASLPLLHPYAFKHGILKEHGMTGCLLFGPPGTGKTLVVRALAKEAGTRMMVVTPSDVMDMYVGEGEKLVKSVFSLARRLAPCIVFIDEIDALFGARSAARETGGAMAHRGVITEFMQEMDGLRTSRQDSVIVIGATNRPFDLDDAVLRRLPRRLLVDLPGEKEREEILRILLRDETLAEDVDLKRLAAKTVSFSGSDLKHLAVAAALDAVKQSVTLPWTRPGEQVAPIVEAASASPDVSSSTAANDTPDTSASETAEAPAGESSEASTSKSRDLEEEFDDLDHPAGRGRVLHLHNFEKALKEITPSSSEHLGTLADIRRWNEEFGEGRRHRKKQVWGKDRFGFTDRREAGEDGRVLPQEVPAAAERSS